MAAQWAVLRYFAQANRFSRTPSAFASFHGTTRGTASQTIKSIETLGYLTRMRSEEDRRSVRLVLTDKARGILANDPFESLVRAADSLPPSVHGHLANALQRMLGQVTQERGKPPFGTCTSCKHLKATAAAGRDRRPMSAGSERAAASGRARRGLHQLRPGQAHDGEGPCHRSRTAMSPVPHQRSLSQTARSPSMPSYSRPSSACRPTPITQVCSTSSEQRHDCRFFSPSWSLVSFTSEKRVPSTGNDMKQSDTGPTPGRPKAGCAPSGGSAAERAASVGAT